MQCKRSSESKGELQAGLAGCSDKGLRLYPMLYFLARCSFGPCSDSQVCSFTCELQLGPVLTLGVKAKVTQDMTPTLSPTLLGSSARAPTAGLCSKEACLGVTARASPLCQSRWCESGVTPGMRIAIARAEPVWD